MTGISAAVARLALLLTAAAGPALAAQDLATPPFPANLQHEVVTRWIVSSTDLPASAPLVFGSDAVAAILTNTQKGSDKSIRTVTFREEGTAANFVTRMGGRSIWGEADVDCRARAIKLNELVIYAGSNRKGREITRMGPRSEWREPAPDRVMSRVVAGACGAAKPLTVAAAGGSGVGLKPSVPASTPVTAPPPAKALPAPPPTKPPAAPLRPAAAASSAQAPVKPVPTQAPSARPPAPKAAPTPPPPPVAPKSPTPQIQAQAQASKPKAPPVQVAAPAPLPPTAAGGVRVQVGAVASAAVAGQEWDRIARQFPEAFKGRNKQSMKVSANGGELHRVLVGGFASKAAAQSFCATLQAKGQACFIRN